MVGTSRHRRVGSRKAPGVLIISNQPPINRRLDLHDCCRHRGKTGHLSNLIFKQVTMVVSFQMSPITKKNIRQQKPECCGKSNNSNQVPLEDLNVDNKLPSEAVPRLAKDRFSFLE